jgi:hypothetical protein
MNWAVMSTGFRTAPKAGTTFRKATWVSADNSGTVSPSSSARSAMSTPAPPDWVTIPSPRPAGGGQSEKAEARSRSASSWSARRIPFWRNTPA